MRSANSRTCIFAFSIAMFASCAFAQGAVRLLVQSSPLAGFRYHAAAEVWEDLHVGDRLELAREADNRFDRNAISVSWRGRKLGYVPRRQNAALAWGMDRGERLSARISRLSTHPNPARRIEFEVYIE
jgi:HIRAN domain